MLTTTIPFAGFYGSIHESLLDGAMEQSLSDSRGCHPISDRISNNIWMHYKTPMVAYTRQYLADFTAKLNEESGLSLKLKWDAIDSPREYNFGTDRLFAKITLKDVKALFKALDKSILDKVAAEEFTSYDGFWSHYSPDWKLWGPVSTWDHNQIGTLLKTAVVQFFEKGWEMDIVEDYGCNGELDGWISGEMDEEGKRLLNIAWYLRKREERAYSATH